MLLDGSHPEAALEAAKWMSEAGKQVILDGSKTDEQIKEPTRRLIPFVDALICGAGFGEKLAGVGDVFEAGEKVLDMGPSVRARSWSASILVFRVYLGVKAVFDEFVW